MGTPGAGAQSSANRLASRSACRTRSAAARKLATQACAAGLSASSKASTRCSSSRPCRVMAITCASARILLTSAVTSPDARKHPDVLDIPGRVERHRKRRPRDPFQELHWHMNLLFCGLIVPEPSVTTIPRSAPSQAWQPARAASALRWQDRFRKDSPRILAKSCGRCSSLPRSRP